MPAVALLATVWTGSAFAQIRVVTYNSASSGGSGAPRTGMSDVLKAMGDQTFTGGFSRPIDVLLIQESLSSASTAQAFVNQMNTLYGTGVYARGTVDGATSGGGTQNVVYNTQTVSLVGETTVGTVSASGQPREVLRHQFRPVGYTSSADFYVYNTHFKSDTGTDDQARRNVEAQAIRTNADAFGSGVRAIYAGDFNMYRSTEAGYQTLLAAGNGQAVDPINRPGNWTANSTFRDVHTQSPAATARYPGQTLGGMDDRFDFQLITTSVASGRGFSYIDGSYRAFGNTGTHALDGSITSGSTSAFQATLPGYTISQAAGVLDKLESVSDHLPVVADYRLPAKMSVAVTSAPARVLVGGAVTVSTTVTNSAPVAVAAGADRLDFSAAGSSALSGSASGSLSALTSGSTFAFTVDTGTAGSKTGTVAVSTTSPQVPIASFSQNIATTVLSHANGSFSAFSDVNITAFNFGTVDAGQSASQPLELSNLSSGAGAALTSAMRVLSVETANANSPFTVQLATGDLAAGLSRSFTVRFDPTQSGTYSDVFTFRLADEDLIGSLDQSLTLTLQGFTPVPEPASMLAVAAGSLWMLRLARRRCRPERPCELAEHVGDRSREPG